MCWPRFRQAHGAGAAALEDIRRCEEWFAQLQLSVPGELALLAAYRARLWLRQGNLAAAEDWARERAAPAGLELELVQQLTLARLRLAQSDAGMPRLSEMNEHLTGLLAVAHERSWMRYEIEILILKALFCRRQDDLRGASSELARALELARDEGYIRSFVDHGAPLGEILARLVAETHNRPPDSTHQHDVHEYALKILAALTGETEAPGDAFPVDQSAARAQPFGGPVLPEQLTERELEVLRLVAGGLSNQDIAERLVVAVSTVKKHLNNIYGKLETQSRTQAIARARELQLL